MREKYNAIAFTPAVTAEQERYGSHFAHDDHGARAAAAREGGIGRDEAEFLAAQDGFYLATVSETGWPYVQYRGGPPGFLKVLDTRTLGWADFRGNRQYISVGNLQRSDKASIIVMDYARKARIKFYGTLTIEDIRGDAARVAELAAPGYRAVVERAVRFDVAAFDWNCPQHITPRFTQTQIAHGVAPLHARIQELEAELAALKG